MIVKKIADKITSVSKKSAKEWQNKETEEDVVRATAKKRYISREERHQIIDELRLVPKRDVSIKFNINDDIRSAYSPNKQIRFKAWMLRSSLCHYIHVYILVNGNITVKNTAVAVAGPKKWKSNI